MMAGCPVKHDSLRLVVLWPTKYDMTGCLVILSNGAFAHR